MKLLSKFLLSSLCLLYASCGSIGWAGAEFHPYEGQQQNWPIAQGAFVDTVNYVIPIYHGPPYKRYMVLGSLDATSAPTRRFGIMRFVARRAMELGADAIIITDRHDEPMGSITTGNGVTNVIGNTAFSSGTAISLPLVFGKASVIMIKWL